MRAVQFDTYGGPEVLTVREVADPAPGAGEVLVDLKAIGINHVDLDVRDGTSRFDITLPHTPGLEGAGVVAEVGPGVTGVAVGDRVALSYIRTCDACQECQSGREMFCPKRGLLGEQIPGTYAERIVVPASLCIALPDSVSFNDAAASIVTYGSTWHALMTRAQVRLGETVLIHSIGSGVGTAGLQIAKAAGAVVIGTVGSDDKIQKALDAGADAVINHTTTDFVEFALNATGGKGVDLVFDMVGGRAFSDSMKAMRPDARLVTIGAHGGEVVQFDVIEFFRRHITYISTHSQSRSELRQVFELLGRGVFDPHIHAVLPLGQAAEAHELIATRANFGKVLLDPTA
jgi:NADPH:quinone reductase-like Zn-dependent oxidoreductase